MPWTDPSPAVGGRGGRPGRPAGGASHPPQWAAPAGEEEAEGSGLARAATRTNGSTRPGSQQLSSPMVEKKERWALLKIKRSGYHQCCGSGSGSAWIRNFCLDLDGIKVPDPDPAKSERAIK